MRKTMLFKSTMLSAALLLGASAVALAAASDHRRHQESDRTVSDGRERSPRVGRDHAERRYHAEQASRHDDEDDDDDDEDDNDAGGRAGQPRPAGPDVPAPDNGLFSGKALPKADVQ